MKSKEIRRIGFNIGIGLVQAFGFAIILGLTINAVLNLFDFGVDDTDLDGWNRSGMKLHVDHRTGIEYLSTSDGGIIRREYR